MFRAIVTVAAIAIGATVVLAQENPVAKRKEWMKSNGTVTKEPAMMLQGREKFDLAKVQAALKNYHQTAEIVPALFPAKPAAGEETTASPKIWEDLPAFKAAFDKFGKEADAAAVKITDEASFKAEFPKVLTNCKSCHDTFRVKT